MRYFFRYNELYKCIVDVNNFILKLKYKESNKTKVPLLKDGEPN